MAAGPYAVSDVKTDEIVVFFPTVGVPTQDGQAWDCTIHGWVYEPGWDPLTVLAGMPPAHREVSQRGQLRLFLVDNERNKHVVIRLGEKNFALEASTVNGHCAGRVRLAAAEVSRLRFGAAGAESTLRFRAVLRRDDPREFTGEIHLLAPAGISVISDIDDTIKLTEVYDRKAMLRNTFREPFRPVAGMAELYQTWARVPGTAFHFISASPWQLYTALEEFRRQAGFPAGSYHLQSFRLKEDTFSDLFDTLESHKRTAIESLLASCPGRGFILVGDSGQKDPEIYGDLARRHPGRIVRILIREVSGQGGEEERYRRAFRDLPEKLCMVFRDAVEVADFVP